MDFGFHQSLNRAVMMHSNGLDQVRRSLQQEIDALNKSLAGLDSRLDKQKFFEYNNTAFMIPKKFEYSPVRRDEVRYKEIKLSLTSSNSRMLAKILSLPFLLSVGIISTKANVR